MSDLTPNIVADTQITPDVFVFRPQMKKVFMTLDIFAIIAALAAAYFHHYLGFTNVDTTYFWIPFILCVIGVLEVAFFSSSFVYRQNVSGQRKIFTSRTGYFGTSSGPLYFLFLPLLIACVLLIPQPANFNSVSYVETIPNTEGVDCPNIPGMLVSHLNRYNGGDCIAVRTDVASYLIDLIAAILVLKGLIRYFRIRKKIIYTDPNRSVLKASSEAVSETGEVVKYEGKNHFYFYAIVFILVAWFLIMLYFVTKYTS
jgi:hypothetical protein